MSDSPGVQQQLASESALPEIPFGGRLFKVGRPDQDAKGRLEKLVKRVAIDEVRVLKDALEPAAYRELFDARTKSLKHYDTWREGWQTVVFDPANAHLFLWSLLQAHHPGVSEGEVKALIEEASEEVVYALTQVMPDFFLVLLAGVKMTPDQRATVEAVVGEIPARLRRIRETPST